MDSYSVRIRRRGDGLIVASIPSLMEARGYGLDQEEALTELIRSLREAFRKTSTGNKTRSRDSALVAC